MDVSVVAKAGYGSKTLSITALKAIIYSLLARFGTDKAAPLGSPLAVDVGQLLIVDAESKLAIASGVLNCAGGKATPAWGDPGVWGNVGLARAAGRALLCDLTKPSASTDGPMVGWDTDQAGTLDGAAWYFDASGVIKVRDQGTTLAFQPLSYTANVVQRLAVVLRAAGAFYLARAAGQSLYTLGWVSNAGTASSLYPAISGLAAAYTADNLRAADLGGAWAQAYGIATSRLVNPAASATATMTPDALIEWTNTFTIGKATWVRYRMQDSQNYWLACAEAADGAISFWQVVNGTYTQRGSGAGAYSAGTNRTVVVVDGNKHTIYVNNVQKISYTDPSNLFINATGIQVNRKDSPITELIAWPRRVALPEGA